MENPKRLGAMSWDESVAMMRSDLRNIPFNEQTAEDFHERRTSCISKLVDSFRNSKPGTMLRFPVIPAARLIRIWLDFGKTGVIRDEKGMANIADHMLNNIALLDATNALSGHSQEQPNDLVEEAGYSMDETEFEKFLEFLTDPDTGAYYVSDFGLEYLGGAYSLIFRASNAEEQLYAVDKALNVVHQRSDLASWFVEGGIKTLQKISDQTGAEQNPKAKEFPHDYASRLKRGFPEIWDAGGNVRGNDAFDLWTRYRRGVRSPEVLHWHDVERPAWLARHRGNSRLAGVVAQIKWGVVGDLGVRGMKKVVEDAIRRVGG